MYRVLRQYTHGRTSRNGSLRKVIHLFCVYSLSDDGRRLNEHTDCEASVRGYYTAMAVNRTRYRHAAASESQMCARY